MSLAIAVSPANVLELEDGSELDFSAGTWSDDGVWSNAVQAYQLPNTGDHVAITARCDRPNESGEYEEVTEHIRIDWEMSGRIDVDNDEAMQYDSVGFSFSVTAKNGDALPRLGVNGISFSYMFFNEDGVEGPTSDVTLTIDDRPFGDRGTGSVACNAVGTVVLIMSYFSGVEICRNEINFSEINVSLDDLVEQINRRAQVKYGYDLCTTASEFSAIRSAAIDVNSYFIKNVTYSSNGNVSSNSETYTTSSLQSEYPEFYWSEATTAEEINEWINTTYRLVTRGTQRVVSASITDAVYKVGSCWDTRHYEEVSYVEDGEIKYKYEWTESWSAAQRRAESSARTEWNAVHSGQSECYRGNGYYNKDDNAGDYMGGILAGSQKSSKFKVKVSTGKSAGFLSAKIQVYAKTDNSYIVFSSLGHGVKPPDAGYYVLHIGTLSDDVVYTSNYLWDFSPFSINWSDNGSSQDVGHGTITAGNALITYKFK